MEFPEPREREAQRTLRTRSVLSLLVFWSICWLKSDKVLFGEELLGFCLFLKIENGEHPDDRSPVSGSGWKDHFRLGSR